jgi:hypothetical protein
MINEIGELAWVVFNRLIAIYFWMDGLLAEGTRCCDQFVNHCADSLCVLWQVKVSDGVY